MACHMYLKAVNWKAYKKYKGAREKFRPFIKHRILSYLLYKEKYGLDPYVSVREIVETFECRENSVRAAINKMVERAALIPLYRKFDRPYNLYKLSAYGRKLANHIWDYPERYKIDLTDYLVNLLLDDKL